ncbi:Stress response protein NST1 [Frankliniella fusca]|uniref:Stress response protein NST1 n=1 Tax=Frankliniella fusca TaxID=407009 RepID=A0AAE1LK33_9NEOP|nr:Stress response protein NST1 [Frankliniella fusca]
MDGPNVNLKLVSDLETYLTKTNDEDDPMFVFMGTCGLRVVNNAFKTGFSDKFSKWYVISFLRSLYNLFKDVPARRSDLIRHSNSHLMPLKFCSVRWLNNAAVALRAKDMLPNLADFKSGIEADPDHKGSKSYSWGVVKDALKDKLMPCNQEVLSKETSIRRIDLNDDKILISPKNFSFRFSIKAEISKLKLTKEEMQTVKEDCVKIIKAICLKIFDKSPLKYKLCRAIRFCDPGLLAHDTKVCLTRLENAPTVFMEKKWIKGTQGDALLKEFKELCSKPSVRASFGLYDKEKERLDHFWRTKVLILSQGNAFVERGFSINKEVIIENQQNKSLVGQRQVYDGIKNLGGVLEMTDIPKQMILKVRNSRDLYQESPKKSREEKQEKGMEETQRKRLAEEVKELKKKKVKLLADQQKEIDKIDEELVMLCGASVLV